MTRPSAIAKCVIGSSARLGGSGIATRALVIRVLTLDARKDTCGTWPLVVVWQVDQVLDRGRVKSLSVALVCTLITRCVDATRVIRARASYVTGVQCSTMDLARANLLNRVDLVAATQAIQTNSLSLLKDKGVDACLHL